MKGKNFPHVGPGQLIGIVGDKGESGCPHIHLEVYEWFDNINGAEPGWRRINPKSIFSPTGEYFNEIVTKEYIDVMNQLSAEDAADCFKELDPTMDWEE